MKQPSLLTLLMAVVFSCSGKYEGTTINIPEKMIKIEKGAVSEYEYKPTGKPTLIIYYGQDECSVCVSETLDKYYSEKLTIINRLRA